MSSRPNAFQLGILRERIKPFRLHWFARLGSTNTRAAAMRRRGELHAPAMVLAGHQTAGRGRGGNTWWSRKGCLTVTFALPVDDRMAPHQLPLIAGLAARAAAAELSGDNGIQIKWPNDLLYTGKKLAGLLCERIDGADLIGIGLNVNLDPAAAPAELAGQIASLAHIRGQPIDMTDALAILASHLRVMLSRATAEPFAVLLREYDAHHALLGREVCIWGVAQQPPLTGKCEGLDAMGRLLLRAGGELHHVISGHVRMI